jgi:ATP-dependent DNA helicase 2 subunit 2
LLLRNGERFATLCTQIQNIISDLVFKQISIQMEKVAKALLIYREEAKLLGPYIYNSWIEQFKTSLLNRKKHEFWEEVIVKEGLGLISANENDMSTVTEQEVEDFYKLNLNKAVATTEADNIDVDDLFANM